MDKEEIREIVKEVISEMKRQNMLNDEFRAGAELIISYYEKGNEKVGEVLKTLRSDPYYRIIPLYYAKHYTNEQLAEMFGCEVSTISRNKKRLCIAIYRKVM